jgi:hypothetical protein
VMAVNPAASPSLLPHSHAECDGRVTPPMVRAPRGARPNRTVPSIAARVRLHQTDRTAAC